MGEEEIAVSGGEGLSRRCFLKAGALVGCSLSSVSWLAGFAEANPVGVSHLLPGGTLDQPAGATRTVYAGCPGHNCGGRCLLTLQVRDGVIVSIESDDRPGDTLASPQLRACVRGRAYRRRQYHTDRLLHPLKRVGARGEGRFEPISWDEALDRVAGELTRVKTTYGNAAIFVPYGTGSYSQTNGRQVAQRLVNLFGGSLGHYNNYSWACMARATETVYGTQVTGNQRQDWLNAKFILMWGWNPSEMRDGTNTEFYLRAARSRGARIVCLDPRHTLSAVSLADEWVPIRPGTDAAMMSAMAHVIISEGLHDAEFVASHCLGFDASQMPDAARGAESYKDYILGTRDRIPKTPSWAEGITGVPRETIVRLAREYATRKPGVLYQGYGMQRRAFGEQVVRAGCALAAITGNVGVPGGWASGMAYQAPSGGPLWSVFPTGVNPVKASIPTFLWTEAVARGPELGPKDGLRGADRLDTGIKLIYAVASNALINQHGNTNRTAAILRNEKLVECLIVQDNFLTPTARFADLVLPACTQLETWGVEDGWKYGDEVLLMPRVVDPPGEARSDYRICADVAAKLGVGAAYTEGRDEHGWVTWALERLKAARYPALPDAAALEAASSVHQAPVEQPAVAFADFRRDPKQFPLRTSSGLIELYSPELAALNRPAEIPAVPKYIQEWESPFGPEARTYPLQVVGHHTLARVHSTMAGVDWLEEAFPQRVFINPLDATARKISSGDEVRVFNARGELRLRCRVTPRVMPGVIAIPQGAWWSPGPDGIDRGGCINVLTSERWTPLAFGNAQHTVMAQVAPTRQAAGA
jgi:anaerobic dimethyl sulfoxide reductase subunit A